MRHPSVHFTRIFEALLGRQNPSFLSLEGLDSVSQVKRQEWHSGQREQHMQRLRDKMELSRLQRMCEGPVWLHVGLGLLVRAGEEHDLESARDDGTADPGSMLKAREL